MIPKRGGPETADLEHAYNRPMHRALVVLALGSCWRAVSAQSTDPCGATLDNGLRVLLLEDHRSPIVTFQIGIGSAAQRAAGRTGIAHFLEHMMFKGTPSYGPRQFAQLVEQNGGRTTPSHRRT